MKCKWPVGPGRVGPGRPGHILFLNKLQSRFAAKTMLLHPKMDQYILLANPEEEKTLILQLTMNHSVLRNPEDDKNLDFATQNGPVCPPPQC